MCKEKTAPTERFKYGAAKGTAIGLISVSVLAIMLAGCQPTGRSFRVKDSSASAGRAGVEEVVSSGSAENTVGEGAVESASSENASTESTSGEQNVASNDSSSSFFSDWFSFGGNNSKIEPPPSIVDKLPVADTPVGGVQKVSLTALSLKNAVGIAIARHPEISRAAAVVSQSSAEVSVAKAAWFPTLEYSVSPGYGGAFGSKNDKTGARATFGASQLVYDFGKTPSTIDAAAANLTKQQYGLNSTIENVAYTAAAYYIEVASSQATLEAARAEITALRKTREMISDRVKAGLSDASDLTQADVAMQRAIVDQVRAQTKLDVAAGNLAEIIGVRPKSVASLTSVDAAVKKLSGGDSNIENAPAVMSSKAAIEEAEARVKMARADYFPAIRVAASKSVSTGSNNSNNSSWVGLSVGGAISTAGQNIYRVDAARAEKEAADKQLESQRLSTRTALSSAATETAGAGVRMDAYNTMKDLSRTSRDLYWQEYTLNKRQLNQVLDAERDIFLAESERITAISDGIVARIKAHTAIGTFVSRLSER